jgi:hypothetical protein
LKTALKLLLQLVLSACSDLSAKLLQNRMSSKSSYALVNAGIWELCLQQPAALHASQFFAVVTFACAVALRAL